MSRKAIILPILAAFVLGTDSVELGQGDQGRSGRSRFSGSNHKKPREDPTKGRYPYGEDGEGEPGVVVAAIDSSEPERHPAKGGTNSLGGNRPRAAQRSARDWSKINLDEVEEEWKVGDEEEELVTPDEELYRLLERRREEAAARLSEVMAEGTPGGGGKIEDTDQFERLAEEVQHADKPGMIFAKVRETVPPSNAKSIGTKKVSDWDWDSLAHLCEEWRNQLEFKMIDITCYPMESELSILVTVQKGWDSRAVFEYLARRGDILSEVSWNNNKMHPKQGFVEDD